MILIKHPDTPVITVSRKIIEWQWLVLLSIGRSYTYRSHLSSLLESMDDGEHKTAIIQTHNTMFTTFLIEWCKIFGTNNNEIHWKKAYAKHYTTDNRITCPANKYEPTVRAFILDNAGVSLKDFNASHGAMTTSRNSYAAHCIPDDMPAMPILEIPYKIANAYSAFLGGARGHNIFPLSEHQDLFESEAKAAFPMPT